MTTPLTVIRITESDGYIQRLSSWISFIYQQTDTRQAHGVSFLFRSKEQTPSDTLVTIIRQYGQRIKIQLTCLSLVIHTRMILANTVIGSTKKSLTQLV